jgi:hypothetical protein
MVGRYALPRDQSRCGATLRDRRLSLDRPMLKSLDTFYEADPRFANIVHSFDQAAGVIQLKSPQSLHEDLAPLALNDAVPEKVRHQFDLARNVYLYSWFVYEFATVAEQQAYSALEAALRHRYQEETGKAPDKPGLKDLFEFSIARKWIDAAEFETEAAWHPDGKFSELDMLRTLRNNLAHGKFHLMPGGSGSYGALQTCHYIISSLFPAADPSAP